MCSVKAKKKDLHKFEHCYKQRINDLANRRKNEQSKKSNSYTPILLDVVNLILEKNILVFGYLTYRPLEKGSNTTGS